MSYDFRQWIAIREAYKNPALTSIPRYAITKRPIIHLENYGQYLQHGQFQRKIQNGHYYLPVVRYEVHTYAERQLPVLDPEQVQYCGKFFFYEPNSTILMDLGNVAFYSGKVAAAQALRPYMTLEEQRRVFLTPKEYLSGLPHPLHDRVFVTMSQTLEKRYNLSLDRIRAIEDVIFYTMPQNITQIPYVSVLTDTDYFTPFNPSIGHDITRFLHLNSDYLDQPICNAAKRKGLETVVLQHENGQNHSTTEILCITPYPHHRLIDLTQSQELSDLFTREELMEMLVFIIFQLN